MGAIVLDSSIVIGFITSTDVHHSSAATEVRAARIREDAFVLPATVLAESMVSSQRVGPDAAETMRADLVELFGPVRTVDESVAVAASRLRSRHRSLRLPDALVIATGIVDAAVVLTCDERLGGIDPCVQIV